MSEASTTDTANSEATETQTGSTDQSSSTTETKTAEAAGKAEGDTILGAAKGDDEPIKDDVKPETKADEPAPNPLLGAPEGDYEIDLGEGVTLDTEALGFIAPVAKEIGLSNDGMAKLAGVYAEQVVPHITAQFTKQMEADIAATSAQWATETKEMIASDPAFEGLDYDAAVRLSAKALDRFGGPELRQFLEQTKMGNNPHVVRFAAMAGKAIAEDTTFERGTTASKPKSAADIFYPPSDT